MPTLDPRARYPSDKNKIAIPTLSGGVGRQAPSKRAVNEAENLDNVLVTLERSVEKRAGTNFIHRYTNPAFNTLSTTPNDSSLKLHDQSLTADYKFFWFQISEEQRYLVAINYASTNTSQYMQIFRVTKTGFYECTIQDYNTQALLDYFTYKGGVAATKADESLSAITLGPQMLINNNKVYAGYTSKERTFTSGDDLNGVDKESGTAWCKIGLDGEFKTLSSNNYDEDLKGRKLVYYTSTPVDPEGQASIYVDGKFYIKNNQVFQSLADGTDLKDYLKKRYNQSGNIEFATVVDPDPLKSATTISEDLPLDFKDFNVTEIKLLDTTDSSVTTDTILITFESQADRDKFKELDKLFLEDIGLTLSDAADASSTQIKWEDSSVSVVSDIIDAADGKSGVPFKLSYNFRGTVEEFTLPTDIQPLVENYGGGDYRLDLDKVGPGLTDNASIVLIFNCIKEGTADQAVPGYSTQAGADEAAFTLRNDDDGGCIAKFIPVEDWRYPDSTRRYLGNKLSDFSEFKLPPKTGDSNRDNDGAKGAASSSSTDFQTLNQPPVDMDGKLQASLPLLYSDIDAQGDGKIYYVENSYAGEVPGYYIIKDDNNSPYSRLIRTPLEYSVLDEDRFPKILKIKTPAVGSTPEIFTVTNMDLEERRSGNLSTNPGPEAFKEGAQRPIQSMAFFRDRLFLSAADTVFSSRTGDFSDFWVQNPGSVADTDPIDVRLSTNKYAEVQTMTPFSSSMFINTGSDIQFTLKGSENSITPFTAEVSPSAFYSTSPMVNPVLLGSQIYFFAPKRAYVFFNDATVSINQAIEVSLTCPQYLPETYGDVSVVPGYDSVCMIDQGSPKFLYMYTNRYQGADVVQNAFYRYIYDVDLMAVNSYDNDIYLVSRHVISGSPDTYEYFLEYQKFYEEDHSIPRLDHQVLITETNTTLGTVTYNGGNDQTTIVAKNYGNLNPDTLYIAVSTAAETRAGEVINLAANRSDVVVSVTQNNGDLSIVLKGDFSTAGDFRKFIIGTSYTSTIQLSPQYMRDQNNNVVEGVLSLRTLHLQHHNTGNYRVEKSTRGRRQTHLEFSPAETDETATIVTDAGNPLFTGDPDDQPMPLYEKIGESFTKIMGFASETDIYVVSDYPNPMNITQIELKGRFTDKTSGFVR